MRYPIFPNIFCLALWMAVSILPLNAGTMDCRKGKEACSLGDRSYWILPPDNWDRKTPLPVMLYFHGWGRQGHVPVNHMHIGGATRKAGILLVAPDGLGKSWDFWRPGSRDTKYAMEVLADVARYFPIDENRLLVGGYSWGSSMAWRFSCEAGNKVHTLLGISGTLYDQTEQCDTGAVEIRHVHGLKDTVMEFPYGPDGSQTGPVRLWRRANGCPSKPSQTGNWQTRQKFTRYLWRKCTSGKSVTLDVHGGGHWIAKGWLARQFEEMSIGGS